MTPPESATPPTDTAPLSCGGSLKTRALELAGGQGRLMLLFAMFVVALGFRCYRLTEPPMDFHPTRQYIGAAVARSYYFNMDSSIPEWRRNIAQIAKDNQELLEPQILPALAAVSYRIVGGEHAWIPRFYSVLAWLGCGIVLLSIGRDIGLSENERLCAFAIHCLTPFSILNSRVFQPDPLMVLLIFLTLRAALRYDRSPTTRGLLVAAALGAAALFVKPVGVFVLFAGFAALMIARRGVPGTARHPHLYLFTGLMLAPAVVFYVLQLTSGGFIGEQTEGSFIPSLLGQFKYWFGWLRMIGRNIGLEGLILALVGMVLQKDRRARWFLGGLWFGYFCYGLFFNYHIHTHDYYSMIVIPIAALSAPPALVRLSGFLRRQWVERRTRLIGAVAAAGAVCAVVGLVVLKTASGGGLGPDAKSRIKLLGSLAGADMKLLDYLGRGIDERGVVERYSRIGELVRHSDKTIYLTHDYGKSLTYHGELAGYAWPGQIVFKKRQMTGQEELDVVKLLAEKIADEGMEFFVSTEWDEFSKQPELRQALAAEHTLIESNRFFQVYDLRLPARAR